MSNYEVSPADARKYNDMFIKAFNSPNEADFQKFASATNNWVQLQLRENSWARAILKPMTITPSQCQREVDRNEIYYLEDVEMNSVAMEIAMRGEPSKEWVSVKRYKITFRKISSKMFQLNEMDLYAINLPIFKIIEQNTIKDIQEQEDKIVMQHVNAGVYLATVHRRNDLIDRGLLTGTYFFADAAEFITFLFTQVKTTPWPVGGVPAGSINYATPQESNIIFSAETSFKRTVITQLAQIPVARQLRGSVILMHEYDYLEVLNWGTADVGLKIADELVVSGYKYTTFAGYTFITTLRDNEYLVPAKCFYIFPEERFLGKFLILNQTKFWMKKEMDNVSMCAYETVGAGFGNILGLGLVILTGGRVLLPVNYCDNAGTVLNSGWQWVINNRTTTPPALTTFPAF